LISKFHIYSIITSQNAKSLSTTIMMAVDFKPLTFTPIEFSLTAGTQIPAPPDSPPMTPTDTDLPTLQEEAGDLTKLHASSNGLVGTPDSKNAPLSPLSANSGGSRKRQGGVRKFLSLRSLRGERGSIRGDLSSPIGSNFSYDTNSSRPGSPFTTQTALSENSPGENGALRHKKSTGWFGTAASRRKSALFIGRLDERIAVDPNHEQENKKPKGPPPPTIPEFTLGKELEMSGDDLFKDIK
jgi:hypothetical protein